MNRNVFKKILTAQEELYQNPEYQMLMAEYARLNERFLQQVEMMNPEQKAAVWDYCGMLIEMHLHTLEIIAS